MRAKLFRQRTAGQRRHDRSWRLQFVAPTDAKDCRHGLCLRRSAITVWVTACVTMSGAKLIPRMMAHMDEMARAAAPYILPRLSAVAMSQKPSRYSIDPTKLSDEELATMTRLAAKAQVPLVEDGGDDNILQ